jgi:hypothetical protein
MNLKSEQDPSADTSLLAMYLYFKEKLHLPEEEARRLAREDALLDKFFFEAYRLPHNLSLRLIYSLPIVIVVIFIVLGLIIKTNWWFYSPGLLLLLFWSSSRKRITFWIPLLYWFNPIGNVPISKDDIDPSDWRSYYFLPYPCGRGNINQMIRASHEQVNLFGNRILVRSLLGTHIFFLGLFCILSFFAWHI